MLDFDTFTKIALECRRFEQINCCQRLYKLARPIIKQSGPTAFEEQFFAVSLVVNDSCPWHWFGTTYSMSV